MRTLVLTIEDFDDGDELESSRTYFEREEDAYKAFRALEDALYEHITGERPRNSALSADTIL
jgi:hypothetical protein